MNDNRTYPVSGPSNHVPGHDEFYLPTDAVAAPVGNREYRDIELPTPAALDTTDAVQAPIAHSGSDSVQNVPEHGAVVTSSTGAVAEMPAEREPKAVMETPSGSLRVDH